MARERGCLVDQTAVIGHVPEDRCWSPGDELHHPVVASSARVNAFVSIDAGTKRPTSVGPGTLLLKHVHVGHDAIVGANCDIATGAVIGGWAEVGNGAKIGLNATILPFRKVGAGARVGAGAVVTKDVEPGDTVAGNPARRIAPNSVPFTDR